MKNQIIIGLTIGLILLTACAGASTVTFGTAGTPPPGGGQIPIDLTPAQLAAIEAASQKYTLPIEDFSIISTEAVTWPDGCLGVQTPGIMCTEALVDGFRIILEANGVQYEFHTNQDGTIVVEATTKLK